MSGHDSATAAASPLALRHWRAETDGNGLCWLCLDQRDASVNVLSREVLGELETVVGALESAPPRGLIIWSGKPGSFIAGADINEFPAIASAEDAFRLVRHGQLILARLAGLPCPSVAVIGGFALGGGLELALACSWRMALTSEKPCIGLPEVQLGLHPGFGATVRLVQLVGVRRAMELMLTGRSITVDEAHRIGLVHRLSPPEQWRAAAAQCISEPQPAVRVSLADRALGLDVLRGVVARSLARRTRSKAHPEHYPAPYALIELWRQHAARGEAAFEAEARSFARLVETPASRNLVRVFFLQERLKRAAGSERPSATHVHVVGAGIMGGDIAAWCALQGLQVTLQDRELKYVEPALARAEKLFAKRLSATAGRDAARGRLRADIAGDGVAAADIVIEAIFENLEAKQSLYRQIEPRLNENAVLATNTSSIPLEDLAGCLQDPGRLIGLHFFNPVARLPLVEVVSTPCTSAAALARGAALTRQIGKLPLPCRSQPGFLVNRILAPYLAEAMELAREGVPLAEIDQAATVFGMPVGPIELADSVGLDIALHVARILAPLIGRQVAPELEERVAAGHLGQKSGRGFYVYQDGRPVRPRVHRGAPRPEVQDRLIYSLLNEAAQCLAEGIVADADLVDAGVIFGTGFAPFRGGPLHYARERGLAAVRTRLEELARQFGPRFRASRGWDSL